jgi:hypothetical protein
MEDSMSLVEAAMLNELRMLTTSRYLLKKVRRDQNIKLKRCVCVNLCELEYRMPYYQGGWNISGLTLAKMLIADPCEKKIERYTWEQKLLWDQSDQSSRPVWLVRVQRLVYLYRLVWPVWRTGLTLREQWLVFERGVFIPHTLTLSWVLMPLHFRTRWDHLGTWEVLPNLSLWDLSD